MVGTAGKILDFACPRSSKIAFHNPRRSNKQQELSHKMEARNSVKETWVRPKACWASVCVWGCGVGGGGECNTPPPPPPLIWNLSVFWQNVSVKFPQQMLSVNLEYFIIKNEMENSINNPVPQKSNFYRRWQLLNKLYKICTDD